MTVDAVEPGRNGDKGHDLNLKRWPEHVCKAWERDRKRKDESVKKRRLEWIWAVFHGLFHKNGKRAR